MTVIFTIGFYRELWTLVFLKELYHLTRGQHRVLHADSHRQWLSACQNRTFVAFTKPEKLRFEVTIEKAYSFDMAWKSAWKTGWKGNAKGL